MNCKTPGEFAAQCARAGIGLQDDLAPLAKQTMLNRTLLKNAAVILPMEGNDAAADGSPTELTHRRYLRFVGSGAALIWMEATAVTKAGRASPHQLYITVENVDRFAALVRRIKAEGMQKNGWEPCVLLQLTHSGRYSKPEGTPRPVIAAHNPVLDEKYGIGADALLIEDEELEELEEAFAFAAGLARQAGFDGVDIKMSHGYLLAELLAAHERKGNYGGSYENRTRLAKNSLQKIRRALSDDFIVVSRMSVYDAFPYPYGFGMRPDGSETPDFSEPARLIGELKAMGLDAVGVTMGNPYFNPHVNRPFEKGPYVPPETPIAGVARFLEITARIKNSTPNMQVIGAGFSYLGSVGAQAAAYMLAQNQIDLAGWGRQAFAYPAFIRDALHGRMPDAKKVCVACSKCSQIMRSGGPAGCPVRDSELYLPIYRQYCK